MTTRRSTRPSRRPAALRRGDVVRLRPRDRSGHEQQGERYAVVVQADELLPRSTVIVAPTSTVARPAGARPQVTVEGSETRVLVEQIVAVDTDRLGAVVTRLDPDEMWAVDDALSFVLGLD